MINSKLDPSTEHPLYKEAARKYKMTLDAFEGDLCKYVPKLSGQTDDEYKAYVSRAANFNIVDRTTQAIIGAMTRKPFTLTGTDTFPASSNTSPDTFIQYALREILIGGRLGVLVDVTAEGSSQLITYCAEDIINWGSDFFVIKESSLQPDPQNRFNLVPVTTYRELFIDESGSYASRNWGMVNKSWVATLNPQLLVSGKPLAYIPLWIVNPYDNTLDIYNPPLFTQASLNIQWFRQATDLAHYAHFMAIPTATIIGELKSYADNDGNIVQTQIRLGSTTQPTQLTAGSTFEYVEVSGSSFKMLQDEMKNTEERMFIAGSRLISLKKGVESVEALQLRSGSESAVLETITNSLEAALNGALQLCAMIDRSGSQVSIALNNDFTAAQMDPQSVKAIMDLYTAQMITLEQALTELYEGEVVTPV
jgi:hypothetical protein